MPTFICSVCGTTFSIPQPALDKYPDWEPAYCKEHSPRKGKTDSTQKKKKRPKNSGSVENDYTLEQVLEKFSEGPIEGIFTDGSSRPNPGPGGWGAVRVSDNQIVNKAYGKAPETTNNRMELTALIEAFKMFEANEYVRIHTDSKLCVQILTEWAKGWERNGWKRKTGPIKNLDLVQEAWEAYQAHPECEVKWIEAHNGWRWNEYADSLACAWCREEL